MSTNHILHSSLGSVSTFQPPVLSDGDKAYYTCPFAKSEIEKGFPELPDFPVLIADGKDDTYQLAPDSNLDEVDSRGQRIVISLRFSEVSELLKAIVNLSGEFDESNCTLCRQDAILHLSKEFVADNFCMVADLARIVSIRLY